MFIKKAGNPEIEDLVNIYIEELMEAGRIEEPTEALKDYVYKILNSGCVESYVVIEGGRIASMCCCNIVNMLPVPGVTTRYYFISDIFTLPRYRNTSFESTLIKYANCEMERKKIKRFEF